MLLVVLSGRLFEAGMAAQSIELAACANKLGVLYSGFIVDALRESERALRMLGIPDGGQVAIAMLLGYPAVHYRRAAPRRPVEVHWL